MGAPCWRDVVASRRGQFISLLISWGHHPRFPFSVIFGPNLFSQCLQREIQNHSVGRAMLSKALGAQEPLSASGVPNPAWPLPCRCIAPVSASISTVFPCVCSRPPSALRHPTQHGHPLSKQGHVLRVWDGPEGRDPPPTQGTVHKGLWVLLPEGADDTAAGFPRASV